MRDIFVYRGAEVYPWFYDLFLPVFWISVARLSAGSGLVILGFCPGLYDLFLPVFWIPASVCFDVPKML